MGKSLVGYLNDAAEYVGIVEPTKSPPVNTNKKKYFTGVTCDQYGRHCVSQDHWGAAPAWHMYGSVGWESEGPIMERSCPLFLSLPWSRGQELPLPFNARRRLQIASFL
mmetsp:Transcript_123161/g.192377  ORF Transcript_123161/g.192377 Transcript_123161/m.192377 type:complete len:109 (+) Transcript_123161:3-329(+)